MDAFGGYDGPIRLIIAGSKRDYIDYAKYTEPSRFGPHQSFHFPGFVTDDEVGMLMDYADLFVFPTLSDTAPLVILEAMAHGLPVLATRVGQVDREAGPDSADELRQVLRGRAADEGEEEEDGEERGAHAGTVARDGCFGQLISY